MSKARIIPLLLVLTLLLSMSPCYAVDASEESQPAMTSETSPEAPSETEPATETVPTDTSAQESQAAPEETVERDPSETSGNTNTGEPINGYADHNEVVVTAPQDPDGTISGSGSGQTQVEIIDKGPTNKPGVSTETKVNNHLNKAAQDADSEVTTMQNGDALIEMQNISIQTPQLSVLLNTLLSMDKQHQQATIENLRKQVEASLTVEDLNQGKLHGSKYMNQFLRELSKWLHNNHDAEPGKGTVSFPTLTDLNALLDNTLEVFPVRGTDLTLGVPSTKDAFDKAVKTYLDMLQGQDAMNINLTKFTIYQAKSYNVRTVYFSQSLVPAEYHWTIGIRDGENMIEEWTESQPYIRLIFETPGAYYVNVKENKNVTRNNFVHGYKTELWVLNNGDIFDGMVFFNHTTTFEAYTGKNIGPRIEEINLTPENFHVNISENMTRAPQTIDKNGYVHKTGQDFTTERG